MLPLPAPFKKTAPSVRWVGFRKRSPTRRNVAFGPWWFPSWNPLPAGHPEMDLLPAATLKEAWLLTSLHEPEQGDRRHLFEAMLNDPRIFVDNCAAVPTQWLSWAEKNGRTGCIMARILSLEPLFRQFVHHIEDCLLEGRLSHGETLAQLMNAAYGEEGDFSLSAASRFQWILVNLALGNHRGRVLESEQWADKAEEMVRGASVSDLKAFAGFYNHGFVGLRHNHYRFEPDLPGPLASLLTSLEAMHGTQCRILPGAQNRTLGALYGTISQNFGFCGPCFSEETRKYAFLAMEAFGVDLSTREDCRRQYCYLVYSLMDSGRFREAEEILLVYLEIGSWDALGDRLPAFERWEHAVLARFLADAGPMEMCRLYGKWVMEKGASMGRETHPWQLWCYNMGRMMLLLGRREDAVLYFKESLDLCLLPRFGPTVRVMGLLPLAGLLKLNHLEGVNLGEMEKVIQNAAESLNPVHFQEVLNEEAFTKTLDRVFEHPAALFPFTYR